MHTQDTQTNGRGDSAAQTAFDPSIVYESTVRLFREHGAETPQQYAQEAYDRTACGVWTAFVLGCGDIKQAGEVIHSSELNDRQNTAEWAARHIVGVVHGTIVEGSDAEFEADPLLFPFTDEELAQTWDYLNEQVDACPTD